eukprot:gene9585-1787_t
MERSKKKEVVVVKDDSEEETMETIKVDSDDDILEIPMVQIKTNEGAQDDYKFIKSVKTKDSELATVIQTDERTFATTGKRGIIQFWDLYTFQCIKEYEKPDDSPKISNLKLLYDGSLLTIGKDYLNIWKDDKLLLSFKPHAHWTRCCTIFRDTYLVTAGKEADGIKKWSIQELLEKEIDHYEVANFDHSWIFTMTNINDEYIGHGGNDKFYIREFDKMKKIKTFDSEFKGDAMRSLYDSRYHYLYIGSYGGDFLVIDCVDWTVKHKQNFGSPVGGILILTNGNVAVGLYNQKIMILSDLISFQIVCELSTNQTQGEIYWLANIQHEFFCSIDGGGSFQMWKINFRIPKLLFMLKQQKDTSVRFIFR